MDVLGRIKSVERTITDAYALNITTDRLIIANASSQLAALLSSFVLADLTSPGIEFYIANTAIALTTEMLNNPNHYIYSLQDVSRAYFENSLRQLNVLGFLVRENSEINGNKSWRIKVNPDQRLSAQIQSLEIARQILLTPEPV